MCVRVCVRACVRACGHLVVFLLLRFPGNKHTQMTILIADQATVYCGTGWLPWWLLLLHHGSYHGVQFLNMTSAVRPGAPPKLLTINQSINQSGTFSCVNTEKPVNDWNFFNLSEASRAPSDWPNILTCSAWMYCAWNTIYAVFYIYCDAYIVHVDIIVNSIFVSSVSMQEGQG